MHLYHEPVAHWLEGSFAMPRVNGSRHSSSFKSFTRNHCPLSSKWGPGGDTVEMRVARRIAHHSTPQSRWPRKSVLSNRHSGTDRKWGLPLPLHLNRPQEDIT